MSWIKGWTNRKPIKLSGGVPPNFDITMSFPHVDFSGETPIIVFVTLKGELSEDQSFYIYFKTDGGVS